MDFLSSLNRLDVILIVVFVFFLLRGLIKGGILVLFSSIGFVAAFFVAFQYYRVLALMIHSIVETWKHVEVISFVIIFFLTWFSIGGLGHWVGKLLRKFGLGFLDRMLGAVVGVVIALIVNACIITSAALFLPSDHPFLINSKIAPYSSQGLSLMYSFIPDDVKRELIKRERLIKRYWAKRRAH